MNRPSLAGFELTGDSLPITGESTQPIVIPRYIAESVRAVTKHRKFNTEQNRALIEIIRRGFVTNHETTEALLNGLLNTPPNTIESSEITPITPPPAAIT